MGAAAAAATCAKTASGYSYVRREPEKTALYKVLQNHLLAFEQEWTDKSDGRTLPAFVTGGLHDFLGCGILARGLAQLFCPTCRERYVVAWSTVAANYRKRLAERGIADGKHGAVAVIQRANSDLRANPHVHAIFLDGLYAKDRDGKGFMFHPAPAPTQQDIEDMVERASKRILRLTCLEMAMVRSRARQNVQRWPR